MSEQAATHFCSVCKNLLSVIASIDDLKLKCERCGTYEKPTEYDTMRYEESTQSNIAIYGSLIFTAGTDPLNPKIKKICECGHDRARYIHLGADLKQINTCIKCNRQWLEGTRETD